MRTTLIRSAARSESGFTLIEVMIAMAILGIGLMSIAVAQISAIKMASKSKNLQQAMFLARESLDDLDALPPQSPLLAFAAVIDDPANPIQVGNDPLDETRFTRQTVITPNSPSAGLSLVTVTVTWSNATTIGTTQAKLSAVKRME